MASATSTQIAQCRFALQLTQREFGELVGKTRRTIQRWEDHGGILLADEAELLANAVRSVEPDLAEELMVIAREAGMPAPPASDEVIASLMQAAAGAMGVSPEAVRPAIVAAFEQAAAEGVDVGAVVAGLRGAAGAVADR